MLDHLESLIQLLSTHSELLSKHKGKIGGTLFGLFGSILFLSLGFWKGMLILASVLMGYLLGSRVDAGHHAIPKDFIRLLFQPRSIRTRHK